jgi:hypothetical protein
MSTKCPIYKADYRRSSRTFQVEDQALNYSIKPTIGPAGAQDGNKTSSASMAPVEQYRIASRSEEIALARSAAPASISSDAEVMVLGDFWW